jgi:hypothetical protein
MKLGISYNLFDCEELLEPSILAIRNNVDYISVVYQTVSNFGNPASEDLEEILESLKYDKIIDDYIKYTPKSYGGHFNELTKRNLGLELSKKKKCTHHLSLDSDEFYLSEQFDNAKKYIEQNNIDTSFLQMRTYYKDQIYQLDPPEDYYVSFIHKLEKDTQYVFNGQSPVLVDPTRRPSGVFNYKIFSREDIEMHHMSGIRDDYRKKLENSSANVNFMQHIDSLVEYYEKWQYPNAALWPGLPPKLQNIIKVDKLFDF